MINTGYYSLKLVRLLVDFLMLFINMYQNGDYKSVNNLLCSFHNFVSKRSLRYRRSLVASSENAENVSPDDSVDTDLPF